MRVDSEMAAGNDAPDFAYDALDFIGQCSTIGVAQNDPARSGVMRSARATQRIVGIGLVAVKEVLAIEHRLAAGLDGGLNAQRNAVQIFLERAAERDMDVIVPRLGDEDDGVGVRGEESRDTRIVLGRSSRA